MRLADFITSKIEPILAEWVAFAAHSGPAGAAMTVTSQKNHAASMLNTIAVDLQTRQTDAQQAEKSKGDAVPPVSGILTAAGIHGAFRAESGYTLGEMVSEFRALRASVIRLWTNANGSLNGDDIDDLMRFNEAIDQATAESIARFMLDLDRSKDMFIAVLGHDLRSPLNAVIMSSQFMVEGGTLDEQNMGLATASLRSARRMNQLVGDLLDFTRSRLGAGVSIVRAEMDMQTVVRHAVEEAAAANPTSVLRLDAPGEVLGMWDASRISQVVANLVVNAIQHGVANTPIEVTVRGQPTEIVLAVHNSGTIAASEIPRLFDPLKRLRPGDSSTPVSGNLGLGLYIADRIVMGHGGKIDVQSSEETGTTFTVHLPR